MVITRRVLWLLVVGMDNHDPAAFCQLWDADFFFRLEIAPLRHCRPPFFLHWGSHMRLCAGEEVSFLLIMPRDCSFGVRVRL